MGSMKADQGRLVSVIIPTHNRARTLQRAIYSVLNQSYRNFELIIVDDASTDGTADLVNEIEDPRIRYHRLPTNGGASRARNVGMRLSKGDFIAFQDSDDEWLADKLAKQVEAANSALGGPVTVFHTKILYGTDAKGNYSRNLVCCIPAINCAPTKDNLLKLVHRGNIISTQTLLLSRDALERVGFFDELLVNSNDWDYAIRLIYDTNVLFLDEPLVMTYLQHDSIMRRQKSGARSELRIMQKLQRRMDVNTSVLGGHLGRIGWGISKLGKPRLARALLFRSIRLAPSNGKNWARLVVNHARTIFG